MLPVFGLLLLSLGFACDGVIRTVAARRKFDEAQDRLAASEAHYRVLADNITDVIALTDLDGRRRYLSPSIETALGYTEQEMVATAGFAYLHPEDATWLPTEIAALAARGGEMTQQYRVLHKNGDVLWVGNSWGASLTRINTKTYAYIY